ncbi:MAG: enoyl-CoA hydratase-related protein [Alphaproteobacteria bacterium]|nr:crotonobetainyl-CoA hydratase [Rhodospirillaceae bacterium]MBT6510382.1 crotonobetainyl-CoA hydratase [Rhodospirillaceae bacterium]MBT7648142.1 crotonobetainyl-CoA hydratase [Rhodospirillaceae bacterium]MDG2479374.1 enoyl-CoA hydratase-related protein [Alphaproteobacteria bacterium]
MSDMVSITKDGAVWEIVFDRPKANAISVAASKALSAAFCSFRDDPTASVAIITGGGEKFFSAGWDLKAAAAGEEDTDSAAGFDGGFAGLTELWSMDKPVIAAVNGYAAGGGFELALASDIIIAAENAQFWLPEAQLGILPDGGGVIRLQRRIPKAVAVEMMMTGRRMTPEEGVRWGLISRVVPQAELMATAREVAHAMSKSAPLSLKAVKAIVNETEGMSVEEAYSHMRGGKIPQYRACLDSEDAKEGPASFAEGREPAWKGR